MAPPAYQLHNPVTMPDIYRALEMIRDCNPGAAAYGIGEIARRLFRNEVGNMQARPVSPDVIAVLEQAELVRTVPAAGYESERNSIDARLKSASEIYAGAKRASWENEKDIIRYGLQYLCSIAGNRKALKSEFYNALEARKWFERDLDAVNLARLGAYGLKSEFGRRMKGFVKAGEHYAALTPDGELMLFYFITSEDLAAESILTPDAFEKYVESAAKHLMETSFSAAPATFAMLGHSADSFPHDPSVAELVLIKASSLDPIIQRLNRVLSRK